MSNRWTAEIRNELMRRHMRQGDLARAIGISDQYLSDMLRGNRSMSQAVAQDIEQAIGVPLDLWYATYGRVPDDLLESYNADELMDVFTQLRIRVTAVHYE